MSTNRLDLSPLELDGANRIFRLNHGDTMDRWSAPPIEGRPFAISATVVAKAMVSWWRKAAIKAAIKTAWRCISKWSFEFCNAHQK